MSTNWLLYISFRWVILLKKRALFDTWVFVNMHKENQLCTCTICRYLMVSICIKAMYRMILPDKTHSKNLSSEYLLCLHVWLISQVEFEQAPASSYQSKTIMNTRVHCKCNLFNLFLNVYCLYKCTVYMYICVII